MSDNITSNICITCVGGKFMYDFVSCLRELGDVKIIGIDADPDAIGQLICDEFYVAPMVRDNPKQYSKLLQKIFIKHDIKIFLPLSDEEVSWSADNFDYLTKDLNAILPFSSPDKVNYIIDKYNFMKCLHDNGLYEDNFYLVNNNIELENALEHLGYPSNKIISKPRLGRGSRGVFLFDNSIQNFTPFLEHRFCGTGNKDNFFNEMKNRNMTISDIVLMPYHRGNFYDIDIVAKDGELKDICIRLRQLKNEFSPTSTGHKICMKQDIIDYAEKICSAVNADGVFDIDVIEMQDGKIVAIDAAFRFSGSVGASRVAGHNMPAQLLRLLLGENISRLPVKDNVILRPFWTMQSIKSGKENILL